MAEGTREEVWNLYRSVRTQTEAICRPLCTEDYVVQTMEDVSPPKWHLGHTTWFFEILILVPHVSGYTPHHPSFHYLFNSYYEGLGNHTPRARRGHLSRPTVAEVYEYRQAVDRAIEQFVHHCPQKIFSYVLPTIILGLHHEQQHQELLVTDIKHVLGTNPIIPAYSTQAALSTQTSVVELEFRPILGGVVEIGAPKEGFSYDNERPRHKVYLREFMLANRCTTNQEYIQFISDGGYQNVHLWLADGWDWIQRDHIRAPMYWQLQNGTWHTVTPHGLAPVVLSEPVCHVSQYEAQAYAQWSQKRLPTEAEWEHAATRWHSTAAEGNFLENQHFHPRSTGNGQTDMLGNVWEWTASAYAPYPGYRAYEGHLAEYNQKFMSNQVVLRGGSCATPRSHIRTSYRNFFQPEKRWQFSGFRLAESL